MAKYLDMDGLAYLWGQIKSRLLTKVDKIEGKGLSTNDYTTEEKTKLSNIEENSNNYIHPISGVSTGVYKSVSVDVNGHVISGSNPTTLIEYGITDAANKVHTHVSDDIISLDASKLTGTISIDRLPHGALERLITVEDDVSRFELTTEHIQHGDTVKVVETGKMYFVVDEMKLSTEEGYVEYSAGTASAVDWSGVINKPDVFIPDAHTHTRSEITDFPITLKNPTALIIEVGGSSISYDGSTERRITIDNVSLGIDSITEEEVDRIMAGS